MYRLIPGRTAAGSMAVIAALCAVSCRPGPPPAPVTATMLTEPIPLPDVTLIDKTGREFTTDRLRGQFSLLFFGFTHCPDVCPLTLAVLARMHADWKTPHIEAPGVVLVSVDPGRDDPERIGTYLDNFDSGFQGVTGSRLAMDPWLKTLGVSVHVEQRPEGEPYSVTHNSTVYVVGPGADLVAVFSPPHDPAAIAADILRIREHYLTAEADAAEPSTSS